MHPFERELTNSLREFIRDHVGKRKKEGKEAVVEAMEKQLEALDDSEAVKEEMSHMTESAAREHFLESLETETQEMQDKYWHYGGDY